MDERRLKVAYLCETDPVHAWAHSGGNQRLFRTIDKHLGDTTYIEYHWGFFQWAKVLIDKLPLKISMRLRFRVHLLLSRFVSRRTASELRKGNYDVVFCTYSFYCLANLRLPHPSLLVFSSDATYTVYKNSEIGAAFGSYLSLSRKFDSYIYKLEKRVYQNVDLALWPSAWLKNNADKLYGLSNSHSYMLPWGANVEDPGQPVFPEAADISEQVNLLFVGRDWFHKGGPLVIEVLNLLLEREQDAHLTIVGCNPPELLNHENVTIHPYLDKAAPEQLAIFQRLFSRSHFFVMPSYESYGFAFCEASAYGLPILCIDVGGVPVEQGVNGFRLPIDAGSESFVDKVLYYKNNIDAYLKLRQTSREYYKDFLNWDAWGSRMRALVLERLKG
ncbi:glycosyltransferase family 4 protein [bacterium SCSIO 12696]|nr:glycosyltransferase family 4 protein [bacterium SCSIO 12696]